VPWPIFIIGTDWTVLGNAYVSPDAARSGSVSSVGWGESGSVGLAAESRREGRAEAFRC
jgi:hypothetical protein